MRRAHLLLAGGVALAAVGGVGLARLGGGAPLAASLGDRPLGAPPAPPEALGNGSPSATSPAPRSPPPGDAALAGQVELDQLTRVDDHYEAPLVGGNRAILTLDPVLQPLAEQLLDDARAPRGAIVVMAPDGRVLALAGRRTESPKGGKDGNSDWRLATEVWAPAASVFKLVTAAALVGRGVTADDKVCFHGGVRSVVASNLTDDKHDRACESLGFGVAHSQNAILAKLAYQRLAPSDLAATAHALGLDRALPPSALPGTAGQLTISQAHDLAFAQGAAGFTGSRLSAAGGALLAATFADGGEQPTPVLVDAVVDDSGNHPIATPPRHRALPTDVARAVGKMMVGTCDFGSAARAFRHGKAAVRVAGKTGTLSSTDPFYMQYSWFVGYAPAERPRVIVSVLLGNPENWRLKGNTAARRLIDAALGAPGERAVDHTATRAARPARRGAHS